MCVCMCALTGGKVAKQNKFSSAYQLAHIQKFSTNFSNDVNKMQHTNVHVCVYVCVCVTWIILIVRCIWLTTYVAFYWRCILWTLHFIDVAFYWRCILLPLHFIDVTFYRRYILLTLHFIDVAFYWRCILLTLHFIDINATSDIPLFPYEFIKHCRRCSISSLNTNSRTESLFDGSYRISSLLQGSFAKETYNFNGKFFIARANNGNDASSHASYR